MGDRGNIVIRQSAGGPGASTADSYLYLYTHWGGSDLPEILQAALKRGQERWDDEPYLARIIFQEMLGGDDGLTGFGISTHVGDNEHDFLLVDCGEQTVAVVPPDKFPTHRKSWSFEEFVKLDPESIGFE